MRKPELKVGQIWAYEASEFRDENLYRIVKVTDADKGKADLEWDWDGPGTHGTCENYDVHRNCILVEDAEPQVIEV